MEKKSLEERFKDGFESLSASGDRQDCYHDKKAGKTDRLKFGCQNEEYNRRPLEEQTYYAFNKISGKWEKRGV